MKNVPLMIAATALLGFGASAAHAQSTQAAQNPQAQQAPAQQQQAQPQRQMPKPDPASADETAKCDKVGNNVVTSLKDGKFDNATSQFDDKMKAALPADKLQTSWKSLTDQYGEPNNIGHADKGFKVQQYTVVTLPIDFPKGEAMAQVACTSNGKVGSLRIVPLNRQAPAQAPGGQS